MGTSIIDLECILFYSILFYSILFYSILFYLECILSRMYSNKKREKRWEMVFRFDSHLRGDREKSTSSVISLNLNRRLQEKTESRQNLFLCAPWVLPPLFFPNQCFQDSILAGKVDVAASSFVDYVVLVEWVRPSVFASNSPSPSNLSYPRPPLPCSFQER